MHSLGSSPGDQKREGAPLYSSMFKKSRADAAEQVQGIGEILREIATHVASIPPSKRHTWQEAAVLATENVKITIKTPYPIQTKRSGKASFRFPEPLNIETVIEEISGESEKSLVVPRGVVVFFLPPPDEESGIHSWEEYFFWKAFALAYIASNLITRWEPNTSMSFEFSDASVLTPILVIKDNIRLFEIHIVVSFSVHKKDLLAIKDSVGLSDPMDPHLTTQILSCQLHQKYKDLTISSLVEQSSSAILLSRLQIMRQDARIKDCILLGSMWLRRFGFTSHVGSGGFGQQEWQYLLLWVLQSRPISVSDSSCSLFQACLVELKRKQIFELDFAWIVSESTIQPCAIQAKDHSSWVVPHMFYRATASSSKLLRQLANQTIYLLEQVSFDDYFRDYLFVRKFDHLTYDTTIHVECEDLEPSHSSAYLKYFPYFLIEQFQSAFEFGLADRALAVITSLPRIPPWSVDECCEPRIGISRLDIRLVLDYQKCKRNWDKGPDATEISSSEAFRSFWRGKAELRRFRDGNFHEYLDWQIPGATKSAMTNIIQFIVDAHLKPWRLGDLKTLGSELDLMLTVISQPPLVKQSSCDQSTREANLFTVALQDSMKAIQIPDTATTCRSIDLPQATVSGNKSRKCRETTIIFHSENNDHWPQNLGVMQKLRAASMISTKKFLLSRHKHEIKIRAIVDGNRADEDASVNLLVFREYCDSLILLKSFCRAENQLQAQRELMRSQGQADVPPAAPSMISLSRCTEYASVHAIVLAVLDRRFKSLGPCIQVFKHWRDRHLLSLQVSDEVVEVLSSYVFMHGVSASRFTCPQSVLSGFLAILSFISNWDWRSQCLILDMSGRDRHHPSFQRPKKWGHESNSATLTLISQDSKRSDKIVIPYAMDAMAAKRCTFLATAACSRMKTKVRRESLKSLFCPATDIYDFVIYTTSIKSSTLRKGNDQSLTTQPADVDRFLCTNLTVMHQEFVDYFYDASKPGTIYGLVKRHWSKWETEIDPFHHRVSILLHEIARLGGSLISSARTLHGK